MNLTELCRTDSPWKDDQISFPIKSNLRNFSVSSIYYIYQNQSISATISSKLISSLVHNGRVREIEKKKILNREILDIFFVSMTSSEALTIIPLKKINTNRILSSLKLRIPSSICGIHALAFRFPPSTSIFEFARLEVTNKTRFNELCNSKTLIHSQVNFQAITNSENSMSKRYHMPPYPVIIGICFGLIFLTWGFILAYFFLHRAYLKSHSISSDTQVTRSNNQVTVRKAEQPWTLKTVKTIARKLNMKSSDKGKQPIAQIGKKKYLVKESKQKYSSPVIPNRFTGNSSSWHPAGRPGMYYQAIDSHIPYFPDELNLQKGQIVLAVEYYEDGWVKVIQMPNLWGIKRPVDLHLQEKNQTQRKFIKHTNCEELSGAVPLCMLHELSIILSESLIRKSPVELNSPFSTVI